MRTIYRRAGQARKNWGTILIRGKRISGAPQASGLVEKIARSRTCRLVYPRGHTPSLQSQCQAPFAVGRPDKRLNFAFPYCYFGLFSCKKSFP
jgi:hypothetical protein